ncbi:hypothetical protein ACFX2A_016995 [Malus domestica]
MIGCSLPKTVTPGLWSSSEPNYLKPRGHCTSNQMWCNDVNMGPNCGKPRFSSHRWNNVHEQEHCPG